MTTRDTFLAKIRAAQPAGRPRPDVPLFDTPPGERLERFRTALAAMGGAVVEGASAVPGIDGNRALAADMSPALLQDVDAGVVRARFGVAETGSVWFSEDEYIVNSIGYLVQHLVVLLDPVQIVDGLQDVYRRDDFKAARYAVLVTGPSATADIEGVLIRGAQGVRSLTVVLLAA
jgi:L-lactate dehydrogenase complex protein LldG